MHLFPSFQPQVRQILDNVPALIEKVFPVPARFRSALPADIRELSRLLTSARGERALSYLGRPNLLSAYLRYFLPWNLYRLCRLLPGLELSLKPGDVIIDLGSGPLTMPAALWISRPELRSLPLEFRCIDQNSPVLEAGKKFFSALCGSGCPWKVHITKGDIGKAKARQPAALVCALNVFNEMQNKLSHSEKGQIQKAENASRLLKGLTSANGSILVVEPGTPNSGQFVSLLRGALLGYGFSPVSPCPHTAACPMPGGFSVIGGQKTKNRWCHFAFETDHAPKALHRLSALAKIPKERAVLSFLLAGNTSGRKNLTGVRVVSDAFSLTHGHFGRYACCACGLVLLAGEKKAMEKASSGSLIPVELTGNEERDSKSGALISFLDTEINFA